MTPVDKSSQASPRDVVRPLPMISVEPEGAASFPPPPQSATGRAFAAPFTHPAPPPVSRPPESPRSRRFEPVESYPSQYSRRPEYGGPAGYHFDQTVRPRAENIADQIPLQPLPWFDRLLMAFGVLELILMVIGFWHAGSAGR